MCDMWCDMLQQARTPAQIHDILEGMPEEFLPDVLVFLIFLFSLPTTVSAYTIRYWVVFRPPVLQSL